MCTVSWILGEEGFVLFCNRDERRERGPELAPAELLVDGTRVLAPRDGEALGTWVCVNEHGLALALLNGYGEARAPRGALRSRGQVVLELAGAIAREELIARLERIELERVSPFALLALEPGREAALFAWDGELLARRRDVLAPLVSSSFDAPTVRARRTELYRASARAGGASAELLESYHASHADGPGPYSVCMHREDAQTRSFTRIDVSGAQVRLRYTPGPPCSTRPTAALALPHRSRAAAPAGAGDLGRREP